MPELENFPTAQQAEANSCWACASRMINNWYQSINRSGQNPIYDSDQAFADAWAELEGVEAYRDINVQRSAALALGNFGYDNNIDEQALPSGDEISYQILQHRPLLAIVGDELPDPCPNAEYNNGHWVVIVGINDAQTILQVFDPADGQIHEVAYNAITYQEGVYWQNTSYVDPI